MYSEPMVGTISDKKSTKDYEANFGKPIKNERRSSKRKSEMNVATSNMISEKERDSKN